MMNGIFLLLGTNLGDKPQNLQQAIRFLEEDKIEVVRQSSVYKTAPWGKEDQDWFLNMVIEVATPLSPDDLLSRCLNIEKKMGRERIEKWGSRIIDIDILYYQNLIISKADLVIPHPGIPSRNFTLFPLAELIPDEIHPSLNRSQKQLLDESNDQSGCFKTDLSLDP